MSEPFPPDPVRSVALLVSFQIQLSLGLLYQFGRAEVRSEKATNHDEMVAALARQLAGQGWAVLADHIGWINGGPPVVNGFVPDVMARDGSRTIVAEVETWSSLLPGHSQQQWATFAQSGHEFWLVVPRGARSVASLSAKRLGISPMILEL